LQGNVFNDYFFRIYRPRYLMMWVVLWIQVCVGVGCSEATLPKSQPIPIRHCVNLGNALEAPNEGESRYVIQAEHLHLIREAGFDTVRIPIRWSGHADTIAPFIIDSSFFARVDEVIEQAFSAELQVIIDFHHYDELMAYPEQHQARFLALWEQIAAHYKDYPTMLYFGIFNEPHGNLTGEVWNEMLASAITTIRQIAPRHTLIFGGDSWNTLDGLGNLQYDDTLENILIAVHYYAPFEFTHQGMPHVEGAMAWVGTSFGSAEDIRQVERDFRTIAQWSRSQDVPMLLEEFGVYEAVPLTQRAFYTQTIARQAEAQGMGWCYWDFAGDFHLYHQEAEAWVPEMLSALLSPTE
jgi:endoglucanase